MATSAYYTWDAAGRGWQLAQPIKDMVALARRRGIAILGTIGNEEHLQSSWPEDHTPFSKTFWPVQALGWVCACDLANAQGLGEAILRGARRGLCPWLKYINFGGRTYSHEDGFQAGRPNGDEHVHLSCRSDWLTRGIGTYDPFAPPEEIDMLPDERANLKATDARLRRFVKGEMTFGDDLDNDLDNDPIWPNVQLAEIRKELADLKARPVGAPTSEQMAALTADLRAGLPTLAEIATAVAEEQHRRSAE